MTGDSGSGPTGAVTGDSGSGPTGAVTGDSGSGPTTAGTAGMVPDAGRAWLGPLGVRLLLAFLVVALSSVAVLTVAALLGTGQGLARAQQQQREQGAARAAEAAGQAYRAAGGWTGARLSAAAAVADGVQAQQLIVRDTRGFMVYPGQGRGMGPRRDSPAAVSAAVVVDGARVGEVRLMFGSVPAPGRGVAWDWVAGAAGVALVVALAVSWFVSRRLSLALAALTRAARGFAAGDRQARATGRFPGELGELAAEFNAMADRVVASETTRRRLAADVAHELRTPLAALRAGLEELRDGYLPADTARLSTLHDQSLRLGRVVDDLAELSAAEAAALSLNLSVVDLAAVTGAALDAHEPRLRAAGLTVRRDIAGPVPVRGDPDRLHQAIGNLLANAARFCRPGDSVGVTVSVHSGQGLLEVCDTGPGIPAGDLPHIFDRLWRGAGARSVAGSGIGLAVVRELVAAHGGTVTARSTPGRGAVFTIHLPLAGRPTGRRGHRPGTR